MGIAGLLLLFGVYIVAMPAVREMAFSFNEVSWLPTAIALALLAAAIVLFVQLYQSVGSVIEGIAKSRAAKSAGEQQQR